MTQSDAFTEDGVGVVYTDSGILRVYTVNSGNFMPINCFVLEKSVNAVYPYFSIMC